MACQGRRPVIVISGQPGSGKSTYARRLANELGLRYYTTGQAFRELAKRMGVSLVELNEMAERDPRIDLEIDRASIEEAKKGCVVIDSHLAAWILGDLADVLIYVKASLTERAQRIASRDAVSLSEAMQEASKRELSHWARFESYYGVDIRDLSGFHLVIDTTSLSIEKAYNIILTFVKNFLSTS
ncbi:MAG: (d)CMP kinase [Acidilobus sp.]